MATDVKDAIKTSLEQAKTFYLLDLEAIAEEKLGVSPGGVARAPFDFTLEIADVNRRFAAGMRDETLEKRSDEERASLIAGMTKASAKQMIEDSVGELIAAWMGLADDQIEKMIPAFGDERPAFAMASLAATHMMYHDGQLNYLQALNGDGAIHWM